MIESNTSGQNSGGVENVYGTVALTDDTIAGNSAVVVGGGLTNYFGVATVTGSTFVGNSAAYGGGVSSNDTLTLANTTIENNSAVDGAGILNAGPLTITGGTIENNVAGQGGGGIINNAGAVSATGCSFVANTGSAGAAIYMQGGSFTTDGGAIQAPATSTGNEIEVEPGAGVTLSDVTVDSSSTSTAIDVNGGTFSAIGSSITGFLVGVSVENNGSATITDSTLTSDVTGILVGSGASDTCAVTATNDSFAGDTTGVQNNQTGGSLNATLDWWGSATGPAIASNPGGTGAAAVGNVSFSPWLGDSNIVAPDYLVFLSTTGAQYVVTPDSGNSSLQVTLGGSPVGSIPGGDTLGFTGSGGTVTINGETGASSSDVFDINDATVQFAGADALAGSTVNFTGTAITRNINAQGTVNTFNVQGAGVSGAELEASSVMPLRMPSSSAARRS